MKVKEVYLTMSTKEIQRLEVMEKLKSRLLTQKEASSVLGISTRQVKRIWHRYKRDGALGLVSQRRGKPSNHKMAPSVKEEAILLIREHYHDFHPTFAHEKLIEKHGLNFSVETLRQWMIEAKLWNRQRKKTVRIHQLRERRSCFGELVQLDGSPHDWFEGRAAYCCLLVLVDDATSALLELRFEPVETTDGYFRLIKSYFKQYGLPAAFYSDRHSIFRVNMAEAKTGDGNTQFSRAMKQLNIQLITANSPQAKGRVERANKTLQDRLIKEMRLRKINSIEDANAFLPEFIADFNERFAKEPKCDANAHRELHLEDEALGHILSHQEHRTLTKNLECSIDNVIYQINAQEQKYRLQNKKILVCKDDKAQVTLFHQNKKLNYKIYDKNNKPTPIEDSKTLN